MVLILDGVNQLSGTALNLEWLPRFFPPKIRFIISSTVEQTLVHLRERNWGQLGMQPLHEKERETIILHLLGQYGKSLSREQVARIASDEKSAHPLFLRTLLEELRVFGHHAQLDAVIDRYLATTGTEDLFQVVLARFEEDFGAHTVRNVLSLVWATRTGLSENELQELTGVSRLEIASFVIALDYHLLRNDGLLSFFHDYLRRAVMKRYLEDDEKQRLRHLTLADYFEGIVDELIARDEAAEAAEKLAVA
jgi:nephrocystin-3